MYFLFISPLFQSSFLASLPAPGAASADGANPFLDGAKLHLAAKKGLGY